MASSRSRPVKNRRSTVAAPDRRRAPDALPKTISSGRLLSEIPEFAGPVWAMAVVAARVCPDRKDRDDVASLTFMKACVGWRTFKGRGSRQSWMTGIAHYVYGHVLRARARSRIREKIGGLQMLAARSPASEFQPPDQAAADREKELRVHVLLAKLARKNPTWACIVRLRFLEECSVKSIAEGLGTRAVNVSRMVGRALEWSRKNVAGVGLASFAPAS
jgi:RNA polymerase sigma factor (sigma-70 family)